MQVGMPVQKLPGGLDGDDSSGKSVAAGIFTEERGKSLPGAQGEFGEKPSPIPECRPQDLGECEDEMPVRNGAYHLLPDEFRPQGGAFGAAGGAEPSLFAGEGDEIFVSADVAPDAREAALGKAAPEIRYVTFKAVNYRLLQFPLDNATGGMAMADKVNGSTVMLLRPTEAVRALGLHPQTLANFRHSGKGPEYVRIGGAIRYDADALRDYVLANTKAPHLARSFPEVANTACMFLHIVIWSKRRTTDSPWTDTRFRWDERYPPVGWGSIETMRKRKAE
jgi:hypothetical protein